MRPNTSTSSSSAAAPAAARWPTRWPATGARILVLERGDFVPQEAENWSPEAVWRDLRYRTRERWLDARGAEFRPTRTTASAATPSSGAACCTGCGARTSRRSSTPTACRRRGRSTTTRSRRTTTAPSSSITCTAKSATIRPSRRAARFRIRRCRTRAAWRAIADALRAQGLHPSPLPLGLIDPAAPAGCGLCRHLQLVSRARSHAKSDAEVVVVRPAARHANVTLLDARHCASGSSPTRPAAASRPSTSNVTAQRTPSSRRSIIVSCGAVNSAALLLRSANDRHPDGLANSSGLVGRATWRTWRR